MSDILVTAMRRVNNTVMVRNSQLDHDEAGHIAFRVRKLGVRFRTPACKMVLLILRVSLLFTVKPFWKFLLDVLRGVLHKYVKYFLLL